MGIYSKRYLSIKKNGEFQYLFKKGESIVTPLFVCYIKASNRHKNRCGIITSKKIGNAVKRNRSRRVIREAFRQLEPELRASTDCRYDFVFVARGKTPFVKSTKVLSLMKKQIPDRLPAKSGRKP